MFLSILKKKYFLDSASSAEWQRGRCHSERLRESRIKRFWILNQVGDDKLLWIPSQAENDKEKRRMDPWSGQGWQNGRLSALPLSDIPHTLSVIPNYPFCHSRDLYVIPAKAGIQD
jgi:hypothetical protein